MRRAARPDVLGRQSRLPRAVGRILLCVCVVVFAAHAWAQATPSGSEPKAEPKAKAKDKPKTEDKPKVESKTGSSDTPKGDDKASAKDETGPTAKDDGKSSVGAGAQPTPVDRSRIEALRKAKAGPRGHAGQRAQIGQRAQVGGRTAGKGGRTQTFVMDPNAKWVCDKPEVALDPIWRGNQQLTFSFDIRNEGTAPLRIKAKGG